MNSKNLFYLTEECNMNCEYCYEKESRENKDKLKTSTREEIDDFITDMIERESGSNSTVRLFGGEPLLYPALMLYFTEQLLKRKPNTGLNILTNGTSLLNDSIFEFVKRVYDITRGRMSMTFEISWDGSGHFRRVYNDGSPTREDVERAMTKLTDNNLKFAVSYAVHNGNKEDVLKDYIYLAEKFGKNIISKIDLTYVCIEIEREKHKNELRPMAEKLFKIYGIPICDNLVCHLCKKCVKTDKNLNINVPGKKPFIRSSYQEVKWDYFDEGVNE